MTLMPDASTTIVSVPLASLRADLPSLALAAIFVAAGLATIVLWRLRSREPLLLWLGILTILYGTRLGVGTELFQVAVKLSQSSVTLTNAVITSLILGPFAFAKYARMQVPFAAGDRLLLYTDGIIEATFSDGHEFGIARLKEFARDNKASLADRLIAAVSGPVREDDLTVVAAEAA
jgi:hypothetical protein